MRKYILIITLLVSSFFFSGCKTSLSDLLPTYKSKSATELQIEDLKKAHEIELKEKSEEISRQKDEIISSKDNQMQEAANSMFAADNAFSFYREPERLDIIINNRVNEGVAAIGLGPTPEAVKEENKRLKEELDETVTSLDDLKKNHDAKVSENSLLVAQTESLKKELLNLENERKKQETEFRRKLDEKQDELNKLNNKIINLENERANDRQAIIDFKKKVSTACGIIGLVCLGAAIWSPFYKEKFGICAGIASFIAIGIWYLQMWHVVAVGGVMFLGLLLWVLRKHFVAAKINTALVNKIQDDKEADPDKFKTEHKDSLEEWTTKYTKGKDGSIQKIPDKSVIEGIDKILMENNRK